MKAFASMDWGYNAPGCVLWWACLLDGHYHIFDELKFQYTPVYEVSAAVQTRCRAWGVKLDYLIADPAMWQHTGADRGEAIAETMVRLKLPMRKGDNDRKNGWQRVHEFLRTAPDGRPWLTVDERCRYLRRTIAGAMSDKNDADDVNTNSDDHAIDALRYGAMSRPLTGHLGEERSHVFAPGTMGHLRQSVRASVSRLGAESARG